MKKLMYCCAVILLLCWTGTASAGIAIENGQLMGATGIEVAGQLYDVLFVDGTAEDLFSTLGVYNFAFDNLAGAAEASQALLDQIFIEQTVDGIDMTIYDHSPQLTNGIEHPETAYIYTPYEFFPVHDILGISVTINWVTGDVISTTGIANLVDMSSHADGVYAVWSETTQVPIPSTMTLLGLGLAGLAGVRRKNKRKTLSP